MKKVTKLCFLFTGLLLVSWNLWGQSGSSCTDPLAAVVGTNHADNSNGDQWFVYTATANKKITLSTCGLTTVDTYVAVYNSCNGGAITSNDNNCSLQSKVTFKADSGQNYYIVWRNWLNQAGFDWQLDESELIPGEMCESAIVASDTNQANITNGDQWFVYQPIHNKRVTISSCGIIASDIEVELYKGDCYSKVFVGESNRTDYTKPLEFRFWADSGQTYYITWKSNVTKGYFCWTLVESDIMPGDFCKNAAIALADTNHTNNSWDDQWFVYTAPRTNRVTISTSGLTNEPTYVEVYKGDCNSLLYVNDNLNILGDQSDLNFRADSGQNYYIRWRNDFTRESYDWILTENDLSSGDFCEDAVPVQLGVNHVDNSWGEKWYVYKPMQNMKLQISINGLTSQAEPRDVAIFTGNCNALYYYQQWSFFADMYKFTFSVNSGQTYYFLWPNLNKSVSFEWTLTEKVDIPGENCENAISAKLGLNFASTSRGNQWFKLKPSKDSWYNINTCLSDTTNVIFTVYSGDCLWFNSERTFTTCFNKNDKILLLSSNTYYFKFTENSSKDFYWSLDIITSAKAPIISDTLRIFPNPVTEQLTIELVNSKSSASYVLYGVDGKQVAKGQFVGSVTLSTKQLKAGIYTLRVIRDGIVEVRKVLKQ